MEKDIEIIQWKDVFNPLNLNLVIKYKDRVIPLFYEANEILSVSAKEWEEYIISEIELYSKAIKEGVTM